MKIDAKLTAFRKEKMEPKGKLIQIKSPQQALGEDDAETKLLYEMLVRAENYIKSFKWCPAIVERFLGYGVGGVIAVFLFRFASKIGGTDESLWVIEGDAPSAYFVLDEAPDAAAALDVYCNLTEDWAQAVLNGTSLENVFPVNAPPTTELAKMLLSRIKFIREKLIPVAKEKIK